ncbi:hypothetical protein [Agromyces lapidis]|uniref:Uncharacterized protein n=1 Tax=Agromyces lapidis TaxID=279574 RepID=A0ABV5SPK6_9MICO|nr:hypothetical protein [Agromyces lapidis]
MFIGVERDTDGQLSSTTSNLMGHLERDERDVAVRDGGAEAIIYDTLRDHGMV